MDDFRRCCNCRHYDDFDSRCKLNPPAYAGDRRDDYGETVSYWSQPIIETAWAEWCGQWHPADESQTESQRAEQIRSLMPSGDGTESTREGCE